MKYDFEKLKPEMDKDLYYEKMQPYFEQGLVREVCSSDYICILALGELLYVASPYRLVEGMPFGVTVTPDVARSIVEKNELLFMYASEIMGSEEYVSKLFFDFSSNNIDRWKKWVEDTRKKAKPKIDANLEKELSESVRRRGR